MDGFQSKTPVKAGLEYPFDSVPETGDTMELLPGLHWVRMPLPFSLKWINLWLIDDGEPGWTIVDTGMPLEDTKGAWRQIFEDKLDGRPVWRIIVTHMHPDHVGNAGWLSRKFPGARLWMSRLEYISCRMLVADTGRDAPQEGIDFYRAAGWQDHHIEEYKRKFGGFGRGVSRMPDAYHRLEEGARIRLGGHDWTVLMGKGHSPEHACLYSESLNVMISGDQLLPRISSNVSVHPTEPDANPLEGWIASCRKLRGALAEDALVLPAHNEPFRGAHTRLDHLINGHETALTRLKKRLQEAPKRAVDVFAVLFGRKIGDDLISMATGEAIAHLNCLIARGQATVTRDADGVDWYRTL
ncbi:MBL fold metallo-hydrolase [Henriciella aquimarina]|uniref:MBL fold metallo-hydrolase n=1 Tax=Henriciella aquimarina TaxID=545261 RepID=UPI0009FDAEFA|nr:MBL fold metallo-hydrolase [Henriciella aquimarina]